MPRTEHVVATPAAEAETAAPRRVDEHRVAFRERRHTGADFLDPTRVLVTEDERERDSRRLHQPFERVEVGGADPCSTDPDQHVRRRNGLGHGPLVELERLVVRAHDGGFHVELTSLLDLGDEGDRTRSGRLEAPGHFDHTRVVGGERISR